MMITDLIKRILKDSRTIAIVGLSPKSHRDSFEVAQYLQTHGYRIIPVNPNAGVAEILGEKVYATLSQAAAEQSVDIVDCFRNSADIPPIVDEAVAIGAKVVWMQLKVAHAAAAAQAEAAGLLVVQDRCIKIDHMALQQGLALS